ncbi:MAG: helix-turn-helix transcriptional regulator [Nitrospirales bacterium]|nr:helix-turn-helix transcriptional regulator [Nitrospirales bacterium]
MNSKIRTLLNKALEKKTQVDLSEEIGTSQGTIYKLLHTETRPTTDTLKKLAAYFRLPLYALLEEEESPLPKTAADSGETHSLDPVIREVIEVMEKLPDEAKQEILRAARKDRDLHELRKRKT